MGDYAGERSTSRSWRSTRKALGETHPDYATSLNNLAVLYESRAITPRPSRSTSRPSKSARNPGEAHPDYAVSLNNLALLYSTLGDYARAEPLYKQALEINKEALGETHPDYATSLSNLADLYNVMSDYTRAEPL